MRLLSGFIGKRTAERREQFKRALLHFESRLGGQLFGSAEKNRRREFFCLDEHTWVWHEEWIDANGQHQVLTTRYDVRPQGVLKSQGHASYQALTPEEARNFKKAVHLYRQRIESEYRRILNAA